MIVQRLYAADECCLDAHFSAKLRKLFQPDEVLTSEVVRGSLSLWARHTQLANMSVERLLALMKSSAHDKHPLIERLVSSSFLTQWLRDHIKGGGHDPRTAQRRTALARRGVPLSATRSCRGRKRWRLDAAGPRRPRGASGVCTFVKQHRLKGKLSLAARRAEASRLMKEYFRLPASDRKRYMEEELDRRDEEDEEVLAEERYQQCAGASLFGLSTREQALRQSVFQRIVQEISPAGALCSGVI